MCLAVMLFMLADYSRGLSKHAMTMMTRYYERAYKKGNTDYHAREKMHNAATVAGMAFANTYLGVCHALASEVSSVTGCHLGLVSGILLPHILRYMAQDKVSHKHMCVFCRCLVRHFNHLLVMH